MYAMFVTLPHVERRNNWMQTDAEYHGLRQAAAYEALMGRPHRNSDDPRTCLQFQYNRRLKRYHGLDAAAIARAH